MFLMQKDTQKLPKICFLPRKIHKKSYIDYFIQEDQILLQ